MNENKTNTRLLELPEEDKLLPVGVDDHDIFSELVKEEKSYKDNPKKFFAETQKLQDDGKYREAFGKLETAKTLTDEEELEKMAFITYKMAEVLQQLAASGTEDKDTSLLTLDEAEGWLKISDGYKKAMQSMKQEYEASGKDMYNQANDLYQMANEGNDDIEAVKLPILNIAEDSLNKSDAFYTKARKVYTGEYYPTPAKKRGFRLGAKAVVSAARSSIRSALSRRS